LMFVMLSMLVDSGWLLITMLVVMISLVCYICCDTTIKLYVDLCKRIVISDIVISIPDTCDAQLLTLTWRSYLVMLVLVRP
jgi:hypothetical protein